MKTFTLPLAILALATALGASVAACSSKDDGGGQGADASADAPDDTNAPDVHHPTNDAAPYDAGQPVYDGAANYTDGGYNPDAVPQLP